MVSNELTAEQKALKEAIEAAEVEYNDAQRKYYNLVYSCEKHVFVRRGESARCAICGSDGGWWCPDSETHTCSYSDSEWCDHCGEPDERK